MRFVSDFCFLWLHILEGVLLSRFVKFSVILVGLVNIFLLLPISHHQALSRVVDVVVTAIFSVQTVVFAFISGRYFQIF